MCSTQPSPCAGADEVYRIVGNVPYALHMNGAPSPRPLLDPADFLAIDTPQEEPARTGFLGRVGARIGDRVHARARQAEIEEIVVDTPARHAGLDPDLARHAQWLPNNRSWESFLDAEKQESLFEMHERYRMMHTSMRQLGIAVTLLLMVVAVLGGAGELISHWKDPQLTSSLLSGLVGGEAARIAAMAAAFAAPAFAFVVLSQAIGAVMEGFFGRHAGTLFTGTLGVIGGVAIMMCLQAGAFVGALVAGIVTVVLWRLLMGVVKAMGWVR